MTVTFIKTISDRETGTAGEDARWHRVRLCRRDDGKYFRVIEISTSKEDWDDHKVWAFPSDKDGAKLSDREVGEPLVGDVNWRCVGDDKIIAAVAAL